MPEQISKYPEVTLAVLQSGGGVCGQGAPRKILTQCPAKQFCSLPGGEICVYGIDEIPRMTQIKVQELARVVAPGGESALWDFSAIGSPEAIIAGAAFMAGLALGRFRRRTRPAARA